MNSFVTGIAAFVPLLLIARTAYFYLEIKVFNANNAKDDRALVPEDTLAPNIGKDKHIPGSSRPLKKIEASASSTQTSTELQFYQISSTSSSVTPSVVQSTVASLSNLTDSFKKRKFNLSNRLEGYLNGELNL